MIYLLALLITGAAWILRYYYDGPAWQEEKTCRTHPDRKKLSLMRGHLPVVRWTPDSDRYLAQGRGERQCRPFHFRFLIGWICGDSTRWWHAVTAGSLILSGPALCWYALTSGLSPVQSLAVVAAFTGCWGAFGLLTLCPVLVDAPAMLVALVGASLSLMSDGTGEVWITRCVLLGVFGVVAGAIKETGPIWLALFAWHPAALVGLVVPLGRLVMTHPAAHEDIIIHPFKSAMQYRRGSLTDARTMLFPWGLGMAALLNPSPQLWTAIVLGYLQPLVASDVTRLVQQIAPVVLVAAVPVIPEHWLPVVLALHLFNPGQKTIQEEQPVRLQ